MHGWSRIKNARGFGGHRTVDLLTLNKKVITGKNHEKLEFVELTYRLKNKINFVEFIPNKLSHKILT